MATRAHCDVSFLKELVQNVRLVTFTNTYRNQCTASHLSLSLQSECEDHSLLSDACTEREATAVNEIFHVHLNTLRAGS